MRRSTVQLTLINASATMQARAVQSLRQRERGDVPGWVLVTLMTGLLVGLIYAFAKDQLMTLLESALEDFSS